MSACWYEILIEESMDSHWSVWFGGMEVLPAGDDCPLPGTLLRGCLPDQPALYGVISQLRNLNLTLVEVKRITAP
jgi:hypothetical protein